MFRNPLLTGDLYEADRRLTRIILVMCGLFLVLYSVLALVSSEGRYLIRLPGIALIGLTAGAMIRIRRERVWVLMALSALVIIVQVTILGPPGTGSLSIPTLAIVIVGVIGGIFVPGPLTVYVIGYSCLMMAAQILWTPETLDDAVLQGATSVISFVLASAAFSWLKHELDRSNTRYRQLFDAIPITIREEDFSDVGTWLEGVRAQGVTDLRSWLEEDLERIRDGARRVRVVDVNRSGVSMLEAHLADEVLGPIPEEGLTNGALAAFVDQFMAIWNNESQVVVEVRDGRSLRNSSIDLLLYWTAPRVGNRVDLLRSKDEFVATISHELRTPLTTVVGLSEELRDGRHHMSSEELDELLELLASESMEVSTIVEDLLTAAKVDGGAVTVAVDDVDLAVEVNTVLRSFGERPILTEADTPAIARGDATRIRQVLRNLLVNAHRYGGPKISVRVSATSDAVSVAVSDNGPPLPEHQRAAVFERYYRAGQQQGLTASVGLGLAVSRELARLMEGDLTYHHDGTNGVFTLSLPIAVTAPHEVHRAAG